MAQIEADATALAEVDADEGEEEDDDDEDEEADDEVAEGAGVTNENLARRIRNQRKRSDRQQRSLRKSLARSAKIDGNRFKALMK